MIKSRELLQKVHKELYSKKAPGEVLNNLMVSKLKEFSDKYECNKDLLFIGAYLSDIRITEAIESGNISQHIDMALEYAKQIYIENKFSAEEIDIINEIISTHHGGDQKYIESKLFK